MKTDTITRLVTALSKCGVPVELLTPIEDWAVTQATPWAHAVGFESWKLVDAEVDLKLEPKWIPIHVHLGQPCSMSVGQRKAFRAEFGACGRFLTVIDHRTNNSGHLVALQVTTEYERNGVRTKKHKLTVWITDLVSFYQACVDAEPLDTRKPEVEKEPKEQKPKFNPEEMAKLLADLDL